MNIEVQEYRNELQHILFRFNITSHWYPQRFDYRRSSSGFPYIAGWPSAWCSPCNIWSTKRMLFPLELHCCPLQGYIFLECGKLEVEYFPPCPPHWIPLGLFTECMTLFRTSKKIFPWTASWLLDVNWGVIGIQFWSLYINICLFHCILPQRSPEEDFLWSKRWGYQCDVMLHLNRICHNLFLYSWTSMFIMFYLK